MGRRDGERDGGDGGWCVGVGVGVAVETYGGWCPQAISFLKLFATFMSNRPGALFHSPGESLRNLLATLDVIIQRENARAIILRDQVNLPLLI